MKKITLLTFLLLSQICFAQTTGNLVKQWDARFGGTGREYVTCSQQTPDGGFVIGGYSISGAGGDISQAGWGGNDMWVVKTDSLGNKKWDKRFGGSNEDRMNGLLQTPDGGFLLVGYSSSGISGNKTQACWNSNSSYGDFWVVKIDSLGNKKWDKRYGGTDYDEAFSIQPTLDGNYIIGGISYSGGVNGNKTSNGPGGYDYWIVKIDPQGNKLWDKSFGGTNTDYLYYVLPTRDKGYILGGTSYSNTGGDKSADDFGFQDYWVVKTDSLGNKEWDKTFGGSSYDEIHFIYQEADGGYLLTGFSYSGADGNKTLPSLGGYDFWTIKIDGAGNKLWENALGGLKFEDDFGCLTRTTDGGFLISGTSYSGTNSFKSENDLGAEQGWLIKTDSLFNEEWDKTIFSRGHEEQCYGYQTRDGGYAAAIMSNADTGGYKSQGTRGDYDYWIVKFRDTTSSCALTNAGIISAVKDTICPGTIAKLNVSGSSGTVQWQSSATGNKGFASISGTTNTLYNPLLYKTTYYRTYTGNGKCSDTSVVFEMVVAPAAFASFFDNTSGHRVTFNSDSSTGGVTRYLWSFGDGDTSSLPNPIHNYATSDTFHVCLTVNNKTNCNYTTCHNVIIYPLGITDVTAESGWKIYPNPFTNEFYISASLSNLPVEAIEVYNVLGQLILQKDFKQNKDNIISVDGSDLTNGIYYLKIKMAQKYYVQPLVKE